MKTLAIFVEINETLLETLETISIIIPCWVNLEDNFLTIICRQEDMAFIERKLADFV